MSQEDINQIQEVWGPYDKYFQSMMENRDVSLSFMNAHLDSELWQAIDWRTFSIADTARRLVGRKTLYTDITYQAQIKELLAWIYLHVEQERGIDPLILERNLQYNVGLFFKHKKQKHPKLPLIVNFVLYNGTQQNYPYNEDICQYFEHPDLARTVMGHVGKPYKLINLNQEPDEVLVSRGSSGLMELLLKRGGRANFLAWMLAHKDLLRTATH